MSGEINIYSLIISAQAGSGQARNELLDKYKPFITKTVSKYCGRYVHVGDDDEFSIGLIAFDEAVLNFRGKSSTGFLAFSELVIKHRLIDYFRAKRRDTTMYLEDVPGEIAQEEDQLTQLLTQESLRQEIIALSQELKNFDITFNDLVQGSPKHKETRKNAIVTAMNIAADGELLKLLFRKKQLPQKDLVNHLDVSPKLLERFRKYIIAVTLIFAGQFEGMQNFILGGE